LYVSIIIDLLASTYCMRRLPQTVYKLRSKYPHSIFIYIS